MLNESVMYQDVNSRCKLCAITPEIEVHRIERHAILTLLMMRSYEVKKPIVSSANRSYEVGHNSLSARKNIAQ